MSHVLVLGGGWVGSAVAGAARTRGGVTVVDPPFDPHLAANDGAATEHLRSLLEREGITAAINACGRISGSDEELDDANHRFPRWLCDSLAGTGVRLVHVGSASEYGDPGSARPVAEHTPLRPIGAYATTKAAGSRVVVDATAGGLDAVVARVFNIVGHPVPPSSPIHQWMSALTELPPEGGEIEVWWPPTTRDFVMLDDVATALVDLAHLATPGTPVVNVCSGTGLRFDEIVLALAEELGVSATVRSADRPGIESVVGDPSLLRRLLGRAPTMTASALARRAVGGTGGRPVPTR